MAWAVDEIMGVLAPNHVWSRGNSELVNAAFARGLSLKNAAALIGVSAPTLRKVYFAEVAGRASAKLREEFKVATEVEASDQSGDAPLVAAIRQAVREEIYVFLTPMWERAAAVEARLDIALHRSGEFATEPLPPLVRLPRDQIEITPGSKDYVVLKAYTRDFGGGPCVHGMKARWTDFPNDIVGIEDLKRLGLYDIYLAAITPTGVKVSTRSDAE